MAESKMSVSEAKDELMKLKKTFAALERLEEILDVAQQAEGNKAKLGAEQKKLEEKEAEVLKAREDADRTVMMEDERVEASRKNARIIIAAQEELVNKAMEETARVQQIEQAKRNAIQKEIGEIESKRDQAAKELKALQDEKEKIEGTYSGASMSNQVRLPHE